MADAALARPGETLPAAFARHAGPPSSEATEQEAHGDAEQEDDADEREGSARGRLVHDAAPPPRSVSPA